MTYQSPTLTPFRTHDPQYNPGIIFIASEAVLTAWSARPAPLGEVIGVTDTDTLRAVDTITHRRPKMVVLEQVFASTSRGSALVNRLQTDPAFHGIEVRALPQDRVAQIPHLGSAASLVALTHLIKPQYRIARREVRLKLARDVNAEIDGSSATVVDVSRSGAQVLSSSVLRPGQRVRMLLAASRIGATIVWAAFEKSS